MIGSVNDEILVLEELAMELLECVRELYPGALAERYQIEEDGSLSELLERVAESRKCYGKGEVLDLGKAASILIEDFRNGRMGRMTLEVCQK